MGFSLGIVGLPNVGKSTLFNVLSKNKANVSNYPFCTIEPNVGIVEVPDERLAVVQKFAGSAQAIPTTIEFVDIAGLVKGAHRGEGLGNRFLGAIREVDAIAHVVRCFKDDNVTHVDGRVDPLADIEVIKAELCLADLAMVEKKLSETKSKAKSGDKALVKLAADLEVLKDKLGRGECADQPIAELQLLTCKPVLYVANVKEPGEEKILEKVKGKVIAVNAKLEAELAELSAEEAAEYAKEMGIAEWGAGKLIRAGYGVLDLVTFFTANSKECRAWTVNKGTKAPEAASKVHSDLERGFIAAEVLHYNDLVNCQSFAQAREKGILHTEGKHYQVLDGDLILVKFNV